MSRWEKPNHLTCREIEWEKWELRKIQLMFLSWSMERQPGHDEKTFYNLLFIAKAELTKICWAYFFVYLFLRNINFVHI